MSYKQSTEKETDIVQLVMIIIITLGLIGLMFKLAGCSEELITSMQSSPCIDNITVTDTNGMIICVDTMDWCYRDTVNSNTIKLYPAYPNPVPIDYNWITVIVQVPAQDTVSLYHITGIDTNYIVYNFAGQGLIVFRINKHNHNLINKQIELRLRTRRNYIYNPFLCNLKGDILFR